MSVAAEAPSMEKLEAIWAPFKQCETLEELEACGKALPPEYRWLLAGISQHDLLALKNPDGTFKPDDGIFGNNTARIRYSDKKGEATVEDTEAVYEEIFDIMSKALLKAEREKKPLHFHVGEFHLDRESAQLSVIALKVANRLGIHHIGVESKKEDSTLKGKLWPGIDNWGKRVLDDNGKLPETHPDAVEGIIQNRHLFLQEARKNSNNYIFPTDDAREDGSSRHEEWAYREREMVNVIQEKTRGEHTIHFCGGGHLYGLRKNTPEEKAVFEGMKTEQSVYLSPPGNEDVPPEENPDRLKENLVKAHRPLLNGVVPSLEKARELSTAADEALGARLAEAFFKKHPDLAPQQATLESAMAGCRVPVSEHGLGRAAG